LHADFRHAFVPLLCAGHLTNLSELLRRNGKGSNPASPSYSGDVNNASTLERKSSIERSLDLGASTASLVLNMYLDGQHDGNEIIMLSELQVRLMPCWMLLDGRATASCGSKCATHLQATAIDLACCLDLEHSDGRFVCRHRLY
jgi:hypothetical protein